MPTAPSASDPPGRRATGAALVALAIGAFYWFYFLPPRLLGSSDPDRYYHLGLSRLIAADGLPRLLRLHAEDLSSKPVRLGPAEVASVRVGTEPAIVPNLSFIEGQIATLP